MTEPRASKKDWGVWNSTVGRWLVGSYLTEKEAIDMAKKLNGLPDKPNPAGRFEPKQDSRV